MKGMKVIGKGHFTTAYMKDNNTVILKSRDKVKECMSLGWFPSSNLFPNVERISYGDDGYAMYEMKYINRVTAPKKQLVKAHYELYKTLRMLSYRCFDNAWQLQDAILKLDLRKDIRDAIHDAVSALTNYGEDVTFEISPRNIGVTKTGKLILMDCFFFKSDLRH